MFSFQSYSFKIAFQKYSINVKVSKLEFQNYMLKFQKVKVKKLCFNFKVMFAFQS